MGNRIGYELRAGVTAAWIARGAALLRTLGPYALLDLLLPGGSLIALLLWLYQRRRRGGAPRIQLADSFGIASMGSRILESARSATRMSQGG
jgi:hypothetical protein